MLGCQLYAATTDPSGKTAKPSPKAERPTRPLGFYLDSSKINLVTLGQFRLFHNEPFKVYGDTFSKSIPVQDRFGNSCPKYFIRKTVFSRNDSAASQITIFKDRALSKGFVEYVIDIPAYDASRPILVLEKPRFRKNGKLFRARWVNQDELYEIVRKDGIDTRHYHRESTWLRGKKIHRIF